MTKFLLVVGLVILGEAVITTTDDDSMACLQSTIRQTMLNHKKNNPRVTESQWEVHNENFGCYTWAPYNNPPDGTPNSGFNFFADETGHTLESCKERCIAGNPNCYSIDFFTDGSGKCIVYNNVVCDNPTGANAQSHRLVYTGKPLQGEMESSESVEEMVSVENVEMVASSEASEEGPTFVNMQGARFDVNVEGVHKLLQIPSKTGDDLEIIGKVERFPKKGHSTCRFFFTQFMIRGAWLGDKDHTMTINAGSVGNYSGFGLEHRKQLLEFNALGSAGVPMKLKGTNLAMCQKTSMEEEDEQLCSQMRKRVQKKHRDLMQIIATPLKSPQSVKLLVSRYVDPSFLGVHVVGLDTVKQKMGGLLVADDLNVDEVPQGCPAQTMSQTTPQLFTSANDFPHIVGVSLPSPTA